MSKVRLVLLTLLAVLSVGVLVASSASAAITFQWKVGGSLLKGGQSRTFTAEADGHVFDLSGKVSGLAVLLLSNKLKVKAGAQIFGGQPGTNEETLEFESVVVDSPFPGKCVAESLPNPVVGNVSTLPLKTEIVEAEPSGKGNGEALVLFTPKSGTTFTEIRFLNKGTETCPLNLVEGPVTGSALALPLPSTSTEVELGVLDSEATTKEYKSFGGPGGKAGLVFAGSAATLAGLSLVVLTSKEKFGAF